MLKNEEKQPFTDKRYQTREFIDYIKLAHIAYFSEQALAENGVKQNLIPAGWTYRRGFSIRTNIDDYTGSIIQSVDSFGSLRKFYAKHLQICEFFSNDKKEAVYSIRGTVSPSDVAADVRLATNGYFIPEALMSDFRRFLDCFQGRGYKITLTGHSLGGYMAIKLLLQNGISEEIVNHYNLKVVAFDPPGVEINFNYDKTRAKRIFVLVPGPNLVNCVHNQVGNLLHIPERTGTKSANNNLMAACQVLATPASLTPDDFITKLFDFSFDQVVAPIIAIGLNGGTRLFGIGEFPVTKNHIISIKNNIKAMIDERLAKYDLKEKIALTYAQHSITEMALNIGINSDMKEIDIEQWPNLNIFLETPTNNLSALIRYIPPRSARNLNFFAQQPREVYINQNYPNRDLMGNVRNDSIYDFICSNSFQLLMAFPVFVAVLIICFYAKDNEYTDIETPSTTPTLR